MSSVLRRLWPVGLWVLLLLAATWQIARTPFVADLSAFLPANPDARQRLLIEQLQAGLPARTVLIGIEGGQAEDRARASTALARQLRDSGLFDQVQNGQTEAFQDIGRWLFEKRFLLSPAIEPDRFTAAGLRTALQEALALLGTPAGNALKPVWERDPTGETVRIAESLIPPDAPRTEAGVWASRPRAEAPGAPSRALLVAVIRAEGADLDAQARALARVQQAFDEGPGAAAAGLVLRVSGAPVFSVHSRAQIEAEVHVLAIAGTVLMGAILLLAFASLRALLVALLPVATGVLCGIAAVATLFGSVHGITLGFGATLIGEAVDYAIYYLIQARQAGVAAWLRTGWPTIRLGLLTSVCGFAALVLSGFPGLQQLGVFSIAGLLGAAAFTRWVLPLWLPQGAAGRGWRAPLGRWSQRVLPLLPRWRWLAWALGAAALALLLQRGELWRADLASLSPLPAPMLELDASLRADLSAGDARTLVVVQGPDLETTLQRAEQLGQELDALVDAGRIAGWDGITRWLPSQATQQRRQASLPPAAPLQAALAEATAGLPLSPARLAPFVADVQAARSQPLLTLADLRQTPVAPLLDALVLQRADGSVAVLMPLHPVGDQAIDAAALRQPWQGRDWVQVVDIGLELQGLYGRYLGQAQQQALWGVLGVVLLMAVTLRSLPRLLAVCLPLALAVLLTMGLLTLLQVPMGILHLVGLLLVAAVGSNYALFFDMLRQQGRVDEDTLASLLLANVTTVAGFGLIALSGIPALSAIGRVVAPGALLALLLSAVLLGPRAAAPSADRPAA